VPIRFYVHWQTLVPSLYSLAAIRPREDDAWSLDDSKATGVVLPQAQVAKLTIASAVAVHVGLTCHRRCAVIDLAFRQHTNPCGGGSAGTAEMWRNAVASSYMWNKIISEDYCGSWIFSNAFSVAEIIWNNFRTLFPAAEIIIFQLHWIIFKWLQCFISHVSGYMWNKTLE